jgi:hypothetical protein
MTFVGAIEVTLFPTAARLVGSVKFPEASALETSQPTKLRVLGMAGL